MKKIITLSAVFALGTIAFAQNSTYQDINQYPKATKTNEQHIINLPAIVGNDSQNKKVEIYVGKYMETDGCNQYNLNGKLDKKTVKSYLDYYNFTTNGNVASTNMGCLNAKPENKFVSSQPLLLDYNSNLPIVIYTPKGYSVQYKIFTADNTTYQAQTVNNF